MLTAPVIALMFSAALMEIAPGENQRLILEVEKTGLMSGKKHIFWFPRFQGKVTYDAAQPLTSSVELIVEAAGLVCKDTWVSEKDRKKVEEHALTEMLMAARHPRIVFRSTAVAPKTAGEFAVSGNLEMRGVTKPVSVSVSRKDGNVFEGTARFRMTDWGMKPPKAALGTIGTKDEVTLTFALTAR